MIAEMRMKHTSIVLARQRCEKSQMSSDFQPSQAQIPEKTPTWGFAEGVDIWQAEFLQVLGDFTENMVLTLGRDIAQQAPYPVLSIWQPARNGMKDPDLILACWV